MIEIKTGRAGRRPRSHISISHNKSGTTMNIPDSLPQSHVVFYHLEDTTFWFGLNNDGNGRKISSKRQVGLPSVLTDTIKFKPGTNDLEVTNLEPGLYAVDITQFE